MYVQIHNDVRCYEKGTSHDYLIYNAIAIDVSHRYKYFIQSCFSPCESSSNSIFMASTTVVLILHVPAIVILYQLFLINADSACMLYYIDIFAFYLTQKLLFVSVFL